MTVLKSIEKAFSEGKPEREWILRQLAGLVSYAKAKIMDHNTGKTDRIKWSRVLVSAAQACTHALKDQELDELREEIKELKTILKETEYERIVEA